MKRGLKRQLAERRTRNQRLAIEDAKHRCGMCKRALPKTGVKMLWGDPAMYCSDGCLEDAREINAVLSTARKGLR